MSADQSPASRVFRVGDVLGRAWRLFIGHLVFFLGTAVFVYAAMIAAVEIITLPAETFGRARLAIRTMIVAATLLVLPLNVIGQGVLLLGAFQLLCGEPLRVGKILWRLLERVLPLLVIVILWGLGLAVCLTLSLVALMVGGGTSAYLLPLVLSLVPTAILLVMWAVAVPPCVVEGLGPFACIRRSNALSKGCRWKILGIMLPLTLLGLAGNLVKLAVAPVNPLLADVAEAAWLVVLIAYWNCTVVVTYHSLRLAKDVVHSGQVASIFD